MKEIVKENLKPVIFIIIVLVLTAISAYPQLKFSGRVVEVIDGKTCVIEVPGGKLTAVLQYIEIPEPEQPLYKTVKEHLQGLILDKSVEFLPRGVKNDRTVGRLFVKGIDVSQQMLRDGAAWYAVFEKSGQDSGESLLYIDNESQAKTEKRGVWSIDSLLTPWDYRAEQEALRQSREREAIEKMKRSGDVRNQKITSPKQRAVRQVEMWADVGGASDFDQPLGLGGLRAGYDPTDRIGHISTPSIYLDIPNGGFLQKVESRVFYIYEGDKSRIEDSIYAVGFLSASKNYKFSNSTVAIITADAQKIVLRQPRRFTHKEASYVKELLFYRMTRAQLLKIVKAEKISVQIGNHKGSISTESLIFINNLLNAS